MAKNSAAKILPGKQTEILDLWLAQQMKDVSFREDVMSADEFMEQSKELLKVVLAGIAKDNFADILGPEFEKATEVLSGISFNQAKNGFSPRETAQFVFSLKEALMTVLERNSTDTSVLFAEALKINNLIDDLAMITMETFIHSREDIIRHQSAEITDISTPVIKIWEGILVLPIIGTLDSARTQVIMENLLMKIVDSESSIAILDISGVPAIDSLVAQHLIKTVAAARLIGAECIISGIRPEIAQTIVHLGIDLHNINTKSSMAHALKQAFAVLKLETHAVAAKSKAINQ